MKSAREGGFLFFWVGLRMPRHWELNAAALKVLTSKFFSSVKRMPRHWVVNAAALNILTSKKFSRVIWMPRHWVVNAAALGILTSKIFSLMSMPRHWILNAAALEFRPKWMPWHSCLNAAALSPVSAYLCFSTFQPYFFSYFGPNNLWITRWRRLMKNRKTWTWQNKNKHKNKMQTKNIGLPPKSALVYSHQPDSFFYFLIRVWRDRSLSTLLFIAQVCRPEV